MPHEQPTTSHQQQNGPRFIAGRSVKGNAVFSGSGPARRAAVRAALVVTIAAVHGLAADGSERNFRRNPAAVAGHAHHLAGATFAAVSVAGGLSLVAAVLATLRF